MSAVLGAVAACGSIFLITLVVHIIIDTIAGAK
jgi:hypothetical protein